MWVDFSYVTVIFFTKSSEKISLEDTLHKTITHFVRGRALHKQSASVSAIL